MDDRVPVLDELGNIVGHFIPAGAGGCCGPMVAAVFVLLFMCYPVGMIVLPPILLFVSTALLLYSKYRYRKALFLMSWFLFLIWLFGIVAVAISGY